MPAFPEGALEQQEAQHIQMKRHLHMHNPVYQPQFFPSNPINAGYEMGNRLPNGPSAVHRKHISMDINTPYRMMENSS